MARLNFSWGITPLELQSPLSGTMSVSIDRKDREVGERLVVEAADEEYMEDLRRQYHELVEAERRRFADAGVDEGGGVVIVLSENEEHDGDGDGEEEIDIKEWRHIFLDCGDNDTGPDPMTGGMMLAH